jgi:hypothetical protein
VRQRAGRQRRAVHPVATLDRVINDYPDWERGGRQRGGQAGHALEDRNCQQLYEIAKDENIPGRSKMGEWDLIKAILKAR